MKKKTENRKGQKSKTKNETKIKKEKGGNWVNRRIYNK